MNELSFVNKYYIKSSIKYENYYKKKKVILTDE